MSGVALVWAANLKGVKPSAKIVLIQLAERHNKDTGRCDPHIKKLAEDCEMHRATVLRHLSYLEEVGVLTRVKRGHENGGRDSSQFELHMEVKSQDCDGVKSQKCDGVKSQIGGGLSRSSVEVKSHQCDPLYIDKPGKNPKEPLKTEFEELWEVVPRKVDKAAAFRAYKAARKKASKEEIRNGMMAYAATRQGQDQTFTKYPATWLNGEGWRNDYSQSNSQQNPELSAKLNRWDKIRKSGQ